MHIQCNHPSHTLVGEAPCTRFLSHAMSGGPKHTVNILELGAVSGIEEHCTTKADRKGKFRDVVYSYQSSPFDGDALEAEGRAAEATIGKLKDQMFAPAQLE